MYGSVFVNVPNTAASFYDTINDLTRPSVMKTVGSIDVTTTYPFTDGSRSEWCGHRGTRPVRGEENGRRPRERQRWCSGASGDA